MVLLEIFTLIYLYAIILGLVTLDERCGIFGPSGAGNADSNNLHVLGA